jgi:hypothetical protein
MTEPYEGTDNQVNQGSGLITLSAQNLLAIFIDYMYGHQSGISTMHSSRRWNNTGRALSIWEDTVM